MNTGHSNYEKVRITAYAAGLLGAFLIMALLVAAMRHYTRPAPVGGNRAEERYKNLQELRAANAKILEGYDWQDQAKGAVRLPIERAMELVLQEWRNPAAARSNLDARVDKFFPPPPPPAAPKPSEFE